MLISLCTGLITEDSSYIRVSVLLFMRKISSLVRKPVSKLNLVLASLLKENGKSNPCKVQVTVGNVKSNLRSNDSDGIKNSTDAHVIDVA